MRKRLKCERLDISCYVRYVVASDSDNPKWLSGIFAEAESLKNNGELYDYEAQVLDELYEWYNTNLPVPPFKAMINKGKWSNTAVTWFRDNAGEPLKRMWDIVAILKEHGISVKYIKKASPGVIVYKDEYQVVAVPDRWV